MDFRRIALQLRDRYRPIAQKASFTGVSRGEMLGLTWNRVHPAIADGNVGHGYRKKDVRSLYLSISDADLLDAIERMVYDHGERDIRVTVREQVK